MKVSKFFFSCLAGGALLMQLAPVANATLIVYEPFDYSQGSQLYDPGTNTGLNGGFGFGGAWRPRANDPVRVPAGTTPVVVGSLAHPTFPGDLPTIGNSVVLTGRDRVGTTNGLSSEPARSLSAVAKTIFAGAPGTTTWMSFLAQRQGSPTNLATPPDATGTNNRYPRGANFGFFNESGGIGSETEILSFGNSSNAVDNTYSIIPRGGGANREGAYDPPGAAPGGGPTNVGAATYPFQDVEWVVVRIDHLAGNDDVYMWLSPDPKSEPSLASAAATIKAGDATNGVFDHAMIGAIRPFLGGEQNAPTAANWRPTAVMALDEIRVGTLYADMSSIVPEPASIALVLLSGLGLVGLRRRS